MAGIRSEYFPKLDLLKKYPKLDLLKKYKKVMFIENESDKKILEILGRKCGIPLPADIVFWSTTETHSNRKRFFDELKKVIPDLKGISLRDRDMENVDVVGDGLVYKAVNLPAEYPLKLLQWRRKNLESYLLCPIAIALAADVTIETVSEFIRTHHAIAITDDGYLEAQPPEALLVCDGKKIFTHAEYGLEKRFGCCKYDVAEMMTNDQVCEDIKTFLTQVRDHFGIR